MTENPFKILEAFTRSDHKLFKGRDTEISQLCEIVSSGNVALVFGESGVGKTSLVQCGFAGKFDDSEWLDIWIRRGKGMVRSLKNALYNKLSDDTKEELRKKRVDITTAELLRQAYLDHFKPVYLIFDQFEELYTLGSSAEKTAIYTELENIVNKNLNCKIILIVRDDFHGKLQELVKYIPQLFSKGLKVLPMKAELAETEVVQNYIIQAGIQADPSAEAISKRIIEVCTNNKRDPVYLPYLQVFLHTLWEKANKQAGKAVFNFELIKEAGPIEDVLRTYLVKCVEETDKENEIGVWAFLQEFVKSSGIRQPVKLSKLTGYKHVAIWAKEFEKKRILNNLEKDQFELAHESLVLLILEKKTKETRPKLPTPAITGNPYKGLLSFDQEDRIKFFGRERVKSELLKRFVQNNLVAVVGPSGAGKSSLVKAGLFPELEKQGYHIISIKPEDVIFITPVNKDYTPVTSIHDLEGKIYRSGHSKIVLYIDQFEQLITRCEDETRRKEFIDFIHSALDAKTIPAGKEVKVILSVRDDYEFEFDNTFRNWRQGKFNVPPFLDTELREIITEPAYYACLEFSPDYLVDSIVRDVQQSNGMLPLLSYTLYNMYETAQVNHKGDGLLTEDDYNYIGGVIGGLQKRANKIHDDYAEQDPHRKAIRNLMLRMVTGIGERAGKKVLETELEFSSEDENRNVKEVLNKFIESRLIITGQNNTGDVYYEPAHDSLVRNWGRLNDWVSDKKGIDFFFYSPVLREAIKAWKLGKLWDDDPQLDTVQRILESDDNWLNKKETEFIQASIRERQKVAQIRKKAEDDRLDLIQEKLNEQQKSKKRLIYGLSAVAFLFVTSLISLFVNGLQLNENDKLLIKAEDAVKKAKYAKASADNESLKTKELLRQSDSLNRKYDSLLHKNDSLLNDLTIKKIEADNSGEKYRQTSIDLSISLKDNKSIIAEKDSLIDQYKRVLAKNDLQKDTFYMSMSIDSLTKERYVDALVAMRFSKNGDDSQQYSSFRNALNRISEAKDSEKGNPNIALGFAKQAYDLYPRAPIDSIALSLANNNLFYRQRIELQQRDTARSTIPFYNFAFLTALSADKTHFAFTSSQGIRTGSYRNGVATIDPAVLNSYLLFKLKDTLNGKAVRDARLIALSYTNNNDLVGIMSDLKIYRWDVNGNALPVKEIPEAKKDTFYIAAASPDGKKVVRDYKDLYLKVTDLETLQETAILKPLDTPGGYIDKFVFAPDSRRLMVVNSSKKYHIVDVEERILTPLSDSAILNASFMPDGRHIIYDKRDSIWVGLPIWMDAGSAGASTKEVSNRRCRNCTSHPTGNILLHRAQMITGILKILMRMTQMIPCSMSIPGSFMERIACKEIPCCGTFLLLAAGHLIFWQTIQYLLTTTGLLHPVLLYSY